MTDLVENWKSIPGYEGLYEASSSGRVRSLDRFCLIGKGMGWRRGKILTAVRAANGYLVVGLSLAGKPRQFFVHRLVMLTFVGPCPSGLQVCHWDGDRTNNALGNLRYDTKEANAADKRRHCTNNEGDTNPRANLTSDVVLEIFKRCLAGEEQKRIAVEFGVSPITVNHIATGRTWRSVTKAEWGRAHVVITPDLVRKINELLEQGMTQNEVVRELGVSRSSVYRHSKNKSGLVDQVCTVTKGAGTPATIGGALCL